MTMHSRAAVAGVFDNRTTAEQAVHALTLAGFGEDQIHFAGAKGETSGVLDYLKSLFNPQDNETQMLNDLLDMGIAPHNAQAYLQAYRAGQCVVAVMAGDRLEEATEILAHSGAYDPSRHPVTQSSDASYIPGQPVESTTNEEDPNIRPPAVP
jgi:hypothetical protein